MSESVPVERPHTAINSACASTVTSPSQANGARNAQQRVGKRISVGPYEFMPARQLVDYNNRVDKHKILEIPPMAKSTFGWKSFDKRGNCTEIQEYYTTEEKRKRLKGKLSQMRKDLEEKRSKGYHKQMVAAVVDLDKDSEVAM